MMFWVVVLHLAGLVLLYLASPNQRWLAQPLAGGGVVAGLLLFTSVWWWAQVWSLVAALFTSVVLAMVGLPLVALFSLLWERNAG